MAKNNNFKIVQDFRDDIIEKDVQMSFIDGKSILCKIVSIGMFEYKIELKVDSEIRTAIVHKSSVKYIMIK